MGASSATACGSKTHTSPASDRIGRVTSTMSRLFDVAITAPGGSRIAGTAPSRNPATAWPGNLLRPARGTAPAIPGRPRGPGRCPRPRFERGHPVEHRYIDAALTTLGQQGILWMTPTLPGVLPWRMLTSISTAGTPPPRSRMRPSGRCVRRHPPTTNRGGWIVNKRKNRGLDSDGTGFGDYL